MKQIVPPSPLDVAVAAGLTGGLLALLLAVVVSGWSFLAVPAVLVLLPSMLWGLR